MRDILFRETRARNCQEIEELRRICCKETDRARQLRIDELSLQLTEIQDLQNKVNSLTDAGFLTIVRQRATLEHPSFPANP